MNKIGVPLLLAAGIVIGFVVKGAPTAGGWLPFLLVLACPIMMVTMMLGGHGHGDHHLDEGSPTERDPKARHE